MTWKTEDKNCPIRTADRKPNEKRDLWGKIKYANLCVIGIPEGEETEKEVENAFEEIMTETFPYLKNEMHIQVQEALRVPDKVNSNRPTPRHVIRSRN